MGGGAVSPTGDDAPATTARCATGPANCPYGRCGEGVPEGGTEAPPPPPKKGLSVLYGRYSNIRVGLKHFGVHLATEQRGVSDEWLEGAGQCPWRAGCHLIGVPRWKSQLV